MAICNPATPLRSIESSTGADVSYISTAAAEGFPFYIPSSSADGP